jgi:hypothetical protein
LNPGSVKHETGRMAITLRRSVILILYTHDESRDTFWTYIAFCETWSLILREEYRLSVFENRVLRRTDVFGPRREEVAGG